MLCKRIYEHKQVLQHIADRLCRGHLSITDLQSHHPSAVSEGHGALICYPAKKTWQAS